MKISLTVASHFQRVLEGFVDSRGVHEVLPYAHNLNFPRQFYSDLDVGVLVDGQIRRGYLLETNQYNRELRRLRIITERLMPYVGHVTCSNSSSSPEEGTCTVCKEDKSVANMCTSCKNALFCGGCFITFLHAELLIVDDDDSLDDNEPKLFKCPSCRYVHQVQLTMLKGGIQVHLDNEAIHDSLT